MKNTLICDVLMIIAKWCFSLLYFNGVFSIGKRLLPNLRRLKMVFKSNSYAEGLLDRFFDRDVLFSLTNFTLVGLVIDGDVVRKLLSMLSQQCSYTFDVRWFVNIPISLSDTSTILLDTFQQLKGRIAVELELQLSSSYDIYSIEAFTPPRMNRSSTTYDYLNENIVRAYVKIGFFSEK